MIIFFNINVCLRIILSKTFGQVGKTLTAYSFFILLLLCLFFKGRCTPPNFVNFAVINCVINNTVKVSKQLCTLYFKTLRDMFLNLVAFLAVRSFISFSITANQ